MDWRPMRQRLYSILYVGELALASWTIGDLTGYLTDKYPHFQVTFSNSKVNLLQLPLYL